ncbi:hypothetical protein RRG08_058531 [Elysia crispata]|uniref:Amino acid transporter transmembrane domain-containing protein n=1 Tax=Elysia crispata TaxID=231223 RepID=A0AAE1AET0_9GAST|nr:hypothetical protein RRG08_058531 [Elysia crispata]
MGKSEKMCLKKDERKQGETSAGLTMITATFFLVGDVAGCGLLTLPWALSRTGWIGILIMITFAGAAIYSAIVLARCWMIVRDRHVECRDQPVRHPYSLIGELAFGKACRRSAKISKAQLLYRCACLQNGLSKVDTEPSVA